MCLENLGVSDSSALEILDGGRLGWVCDAFSPEALSESLAAIWALDDASVNRRRVEADRGCRARYAAPVVGTKLVRLLRELE